MDFDFNKVKATISKADEVPAVTRVRLAENPFTEHFAKSVSKEDADGYGQWLNMVLPSQAEDGKSGHGPVVRKATNYLRSAGKAVGKGVGIRIEELGNETVKVHYRSQPKRDVKRSK